MHLRGDKEVDDSIGKILLTKGLAAQGNIKKFSSLSENFLRKALFNSILYVKIPWRYDLLPKTFMRLLRFIILSS